MSKVKCQRSNVHRKSCLPRQAGFTVAELIVVITIFAVLSSVVLFQFAGFSTSISLQNLAQGIALQIKRAQTAGSQGQQPFLFSGLTCPADEQGDTTCEPSYGVYFDKNNPNQFIYFADLNNNGVYNSEADSEISTIVIKTKDKIEKLCVDIADKEDVIDYCLNNASTSESVNEFHVTFTRPQLSATICSAENDCAYNDAEIIIKSPRGWRRMITVYQIGQIAVE